MTDFKKALEKDLEIFANPKEFAELHLIENAEIPCVIDSEILEERQGITEFGMNEFNMLLYVRTALLKEKGIEKRGYGSHLQVDGRIYTVAAWTENMGMTAITLSVPQMN